MKANEFVKRFGLDSAKNILNNMPAMATSYRVSENNALGMGGLYGRISNINGNINGNIISLIDLKRLIDSHELVEKLGGLENAKDEYFSCVQNNEPASYVAKAIFDVESCQ